MMALRPFTDSLLARLQFHRPVEPSPLFPSEATCRPVPLSPIAPLSADPRRLCITEVDAFRCLRRVYPAATRGDYHWWRHYMGFESITDVGAVNGQAEVISYLAFTQEEWAAYDALSPEPLNPVQVVRPRRQVGRPPKGVGYYPMPAPRRPGRHVQSLYQAPPLSFLLVGGPEEMKDQGTAFLWQNDTRLVTTAEDVLALLTPVIERRWQAETKTTLPASKAVSHADAMSWLFLHGYSRHIMVLDRDEGTKRTVYSAPVDTRSRALFQHSTVSEVSAALKTEVEDDIPFLEF